MESVNHTMPRLKLLAMDTKDLEVFSSCCQDAILKVSDIRYQPVERRFILAVNRFAWEKIGDVERKNDKTYERRKSVIHFERVNHARLLGINQSEADMVLSLLAITFEPVKAPGGTIELIFAGDGAIRLDVECVEAQMADLDASWGTSSRPSHEEDEAS